MSCAACADFHKKRNKIPNCAKCPKPFLDHANEVVWEVYCMASSQQRVAGMGTPLGLDFTALPFVLEVNQVPESEWNVIFQKLMEIQNVAMKIIRKMEEQRKAASAKPPPAQK